MAKTDRTLLSDATVRAVVPLEKIRYLYDSLGLLIEIHPSGGKYWRFKYRFAGGKSGSARMNQICALNWSRFCGNAALADICRTKSTS
ncbi:Arm DNA-binding domain-containing protein [Paraburkholderia graminis]|uniref:Arm DNA-binding domain-containing protein n=1 Tax=Paraburkholderia graminis TaxID=60548 RepID=UPI0038B87005